MSIDLFALMMKQVDLIPVSSYSTSGFRRESDIALALLSRGLVNAEILITHKVSLLSKFELMAKGPGTGVGKVLVVP
jgi:threonine dehydrogenase-like Zn-dependent dehydrogenase